MWKFVLGMAVGLAILTIVIFFFFPQVYLSVLIRTIWHRPIMDAVLVEQSLANNSDFSSDLKFDAMELNFVPPWNGLKKKQETGGMVLLASDQNSILIMKPEQSLVETVRGKQEGALKKIDDYTLFRTIAKVTPESVTPITNAVDANENVAKLVLKPILFLDAKGTIKHFDNGVVKGFKYFNDNPKVGAWVVELFDRKNTHYTILVRGTELETDAFISSVKPHE